MAIDKVMLGATTVGYVYVMKDGVRLLQPTFDMPERLRRQIGIEALSVKLLPKVLPPGLKIIACPSAELTKRPK